MAKTFSSSKQEADITAHDAIVNFDNPSDKDRLFLYRLLVYEAKARSGE